jgi:type I restriction enzyme M protein
MRKSEGKKRRYINDKQINDILREYDSFTESDITKIFDTTDFGYRRIDIKRPLRAKLIITEEGLDELEEQAAFAKLTDEQKSALNFVFAFSRFFIGKYPDVRSDAGVKK